MTGVSAIIFLEGGSGCCGEDNWRLYWVVYVLLLDLGIGVKFEESMGGDEHLFLQVT